MPEIELTALLGSLDGPVTPPLAVAARIWSEVQPELTGLPTVVQVSGRTPERRWSGPLVGSAVAATVLVVGFATWALLPNRDQPPVSGSTTTTQVTTTNPLQPPPNAVVGTPADGFADVLAALESAMERWQPAQDYQYAFRLIIDCDCADEGTRWVRYFQDWPEPDPWDVDAILARIEADISGQPSRIEVAFSPEDGHPTYYSVTWAGSPDPQVLVLATRDFHEITPTASEFDGDWRFTTGVVDGEEFGNPAPWGAIIFTLYPGYAEFDIDCNTGSAWVDIFDGSFGVGPVISTMAGCSEALDISPEASLFLTGLDRADAIDQDGDVLLVSGPSVELRFLAPDSVESLGELPLTAAGESLLLEFPDGRSRGVIYTITEGSRDPWSLVAYTLTAEAEGSDSTATWEVWNGEFDVPDIVITAPGPDRIVIPDTIANGDYQLCSPYWEPDLFCFDLMVRTASAPWFTTAGADGVVLHDADGTSRELTDSPTSIAFYLDGRLITQSGSDGQFPLAPAGPILVDDGSTSAQVPLESGEALLDVAMSNGQLMAIVSARGGSTSVIDLDTGERKVVGPAAVEARIHGDVLLLSSSEDELEARSLDGSLLWTKTIDSETMVVPAEAGLVRLDRFGPLYTESTPAFRQFLQTRILDLATGEEVDSFEYELAIPDEGNEITDRCLRAEVRDQLMLCPQPDGRMITIQVDGGDMIAVPAGRGGIAAYVREAG